MTLLQDLYFTTAVKLAMGFIAFVAQIQLAGKGNLAPTTVVDQLQNFVLGGIIGGVIYNTDIGLLQFLNVLLIWTLIVFISKYLTRHYPRLKRLIDGEPLLVIHHGQVLVDNATKAGLSATDLAYRLRTAGVSDISQVSRGIIELNGQLTVINNGDASLKLPLVLDGKTNPDALDALGQTETWLIDQLHAQGYETADVYMANYQNNRVVIAAYTRTHPLPAEQK